ncbi:hypothetical protein [Lactonifactor longoviformis]|uniref:hypothetical protein n=1 Tax=Lactonifactor longoviformis TaxID=341220 RepID=UPI0036F1D48E
MESIIRRTFEKGEGVFRMVPNFVSRTFNLPGRRLKLHPDDYYYYGTKAGAIMERWFSSINKTRNNNLEREDEGLSYILTFEGEQVLLADAVKELKEELIGDTLQKRYGTWPVFAKFFDYANPLYFHMHPGDEVAERVGCSAKPECYYFPPQLNDCAGKRPSTYFGFNPEVTKEEVEKKLRQFSKCDTHITALSRAFDLEVGTGWYIPAGVLHAPGSLLTYEPQWSTDLNCVFENVVCGEVYDRHFLEDICPEDMEEEERIGYIMDAVDWEANFDPDFKEHYFRPPLTLPKTDKNMTEKWVCYGNDFITAKETTIVPNSTVTLKDNAAYGCVIVQGFGTFGVYQAEAVNMMRAGDLTADEYFVCKDSAERGIQITNSSTTEPMVILQHFGPDNAVYISK